MMSGCCCLFWLGFWLPNGWRMPPRTPCIMGCWRYVSIPQPSFMEFMRCHLVQAKMEQGSCACEEVCPCGGCDSTVLAPHHFQLSSPEVMSRMPRSFEACVVFPRHSVEPCMCDNSQQYNKCSVREPRLVVLK